MFCCCMVQTGNGIELYTGRQCGGGSTGRRCFWVPELATTRDSRAALNLNGAPMIAGRRFQQFYKEVISEMATLEEYIPHEGKSMW